MSYIGATPQIGGYHKLDAITTDGSASYTMQLNSGNFVPESANHLIVSVNGVIQAPTDSFTVSGSTITFASTLSVSDTIDFIMALGNTLDIGVPSDSTVSLSKLTATGTKDATTFLRGDNTFAVPSGGTNTPAFFAYKASGSNQTMTNDTYTKVEFNTESFDTDNNFASNRFTPTTAGKYFIFANIALDASSSNFEYGFVAVYKNGSLLYATNNQQTTNYANHINIPITIIEDANGTTDYFEIWARCADTSGSPVINAGGTDRRCTFGAYKLIGV